MEFLDRIAKNFGTSIYDSRCGATWDVGQAVCAEAYGPDWMLSDTFLLWNQKDDSEQPEPHFYECAKRMAGGYCPAWIDMEGSEP